MTGLLTNKFCGQDIQSVAGGWIVGKDDKLYTYVSGRASNMALDQTGLLTLRRDGNCTPPFSSSPAASKKLLRTGFASLHAPSRGDDLGSTAGAFVLTRAVSWSSPRRFLFVNFKGVALRVSIQDAATNSTIPHFTSAACTPLTADTTRHKVSWPAAPPGAFAALEGRAVRFRFEWQSGSLFSFSVAESGCGASNGHLPGGGMGIDDSGFDLHGSCK